MGQDVPPPARGLHQPVRPEERLDRRRLPPRDLRFSHDGKKLLQTIGEPNVPGTDDKHFYRPTFMAWLPDGTFFVADGYQNTRVVKFDKAASI